MLYLVSFSNLLSLKIVDRTLRPVRVSQSSESCLKTLHKFISRDDDGLFSHTKEHSASFLARSDVYKCRILKVYRDIHLQIIH